MKYIARVLMIISAIAFVQVSIADDMNFQPWSESLFLQIEKEFGKNGADRVRKLHDLMLDNKDKPTHEKLEVVNNAVNQLPWISDQAKYSATDYWATPMETVATFGGDCEDMAITKFMMLRMMGIPKENLRLTYVKIKNTGESHMVLAYLDEPDQMAKGKPVLILDSYVKDLKPSNERKDLLGVYLIDADKNLTLIKDDGKTRSVIAETDSAKIAKLDKIKKKIVENKAKYQKYNEGRPLY
jgi:predicted transglutaminase-like cysteine proteinase